MLNLRIEALPSSVYKTRTAGKLNRKLLLSLVVLLSALLVSNSARSFASGLAGSLALAATGGFCILCIGVLIQSNDVFHFVLLIMFFNCYHYSIIYQKNQVEKQYLFYDFSKIDLTIC